MHGSVYTVNKPLNTVDEYHYYKTCPRLQQTTRRPREHDEDETSGLEECGDCQERREYNRRQRIGLSGPARNLVEADPEDYPLKTDGGTNTVDDVSPKTESVHVTVTAETAAYVDDVKPEWMARGAFLTGCAWMFYGHLQHEHKSSLTTLEQTAVYELKRLGVDIQTIAVAFGVTESIVRNVKARHGEGGEKSLHRRPERGDPNDE